MKIKNTITGLVGTKDSLRYKAMAGSQWLLFKSGIQGGIDLVRTAVFARVLFPDHYGLMALAFLAINLLESFTMLGLEILVYREGGDSEENLSSYWTLRFTRGLILSVLSWFAAMPLAAYYGRPELIWIVRFMGLTFLFNGLATFGREIHQKKMRFGTVAMAEIVASLAVFLLGILFVFVFRNVWALAVFSVMTALGQAVTSYVLYPRLPRFSFRKDALRVVAVFSGSIIGLNILNYLFSNLDVGIIGKRFGLEQLGYYTRAYFLALLPVSYLFNIISPIFMPAFGSILKEPRRLRRAYTKTLLMFFLISAGIGAAFWAFSRPLVLLVYGQRWLPVVPLLQVLIVYGVSKGVVGVAGPIFFLKNKPWLNTLGAAIMVTVFSILCFPLLDRYSLVGIAWAVVIAGLVAHLFAIFSGYVLTARAEGR